ncbi:MAG: ATP-grasp domain-containing protein, partial [Anaerolineae bacterium]|nr:ATP-grasp domain-containing protein [Anaerolineae bacterium]
MNNQKSFSVLIPDGESEFALFVAHCFAPFSNAKLHVLSREQWSPIRFSRFCASYTLMRAGSDDASRLEAVADVVKEKGIDVILPTETKWISFAVANHDALSAFAPVVSLPDPESFEIANNKWLLAQFLQQHQIPCPPTVLVTYDDIFEKKLQDLEFPVLLKPVSAWGGEGIERFERLDDIKRYLDQRDQDRTREKFIVQTLLPGFVVGVNILSREGQMLATTMQRGLIPNTQKYAAAGAIRFIREARFAEIAQKLVSAFSWSGFANVDTLYDSRDEQLKILEINARFWGSLRGSLVAGVSFPYLACLAALDIPFPIPEYELARYFHPTTVVRERLARLLGKNRESPPAFRESGLKFFWADPLAEGTRAFRQLVL